MKAVCHYRRLSTQIVDKNKILTQCLVKIGNNILDVLDADRDTDKPIGDSELAPRFFWNGRVCHCRRMRDQRLDSAQTFAESTQLDVFQNRFCVIKAARLK